MEEPMVLYAGLRVFSLRSINDVTQEFECNFRIFLRWFDDDSGDASLGWEPEYYFLNILSEPFFVDGPLVQRKLLKVQPAAGAAAAPRRRECSLQARMIATFTASMDLHQFPFDLQARRVAHADLFGIERNRDGGTPRRTALRSRSSSACGSRAPTGRASARSRSTRVRVARACGSRTSRRCPTGRR